jgi:hypothetical protein
VPAPVAAPPSVPGSDALTLADAVASRMDAYERALSFMERELTQGRSTQALLIER